MSSRRKSRECALQMLFQGEFNHYEPSKISGIFWSLYPADPETRGFAQLLFDRVNEHRDEIDQRIRRHAQHWRLERMAGVDRNVLRLAIAELLYCDTPEAVVIDEAVEIARRFSARESSDFVNGILDSVMREIKEEAETPSSTVP
ncbi:MAG TPA: transcription antitermination factor NusB [Acidobacteriota bacterium]|nr:transcription antitermination factor NusB [Acidobacteriota bacterium]